MKVGLQTWGSDGDILTMIELGRGLRDVGHEVTLVVTSVDDTDYTHLCRDAGVRYVRVPERIQADWEGLQREVKEGNNLKVLFKYLVHPFAEDMYQAASDLCRDNDVVVSLFLAFPARVAALKAGIPHVGIAFWPGQIPSAHLPPDGEPDHGAEGNRAAWAQRQATTDALLKPEIAAFWESKGLPPLAHVEPDAWYSDELNLIAASPQLWTQQPDWGDRYRLCGSLNALSTTDYELPADLQEFLAAGEAPVYVSFGSPGQTLPQERLVAWMRKASELAGYRVIVQTPMAVEERRQGDVYLIGRVPHYRIFPHCSAIVHHGGAGTSHAAARSGKPSVVMGFSDEQISWGYALERAGVAGEPLCVTSDFGRFDEIVTAEQMAAAVRFVLDSAKIRTKAEEVGARMRDEDGVAQAVALIEGVARARARAGDS